MGHELQKPELELIQLAQPFAIYKGVKGNFGAFRITPKFPTREDLLKRKEGFILIEMCGTRGPNQYDWEHGKVIFKLSHADLSKIEMFLRSPSTPFTFCQAVEGRGGEVANSLQLFHDTTKSSGKAGKETKRLSFFKSDSRDSITAKMVHQKNIEGETPLNREIVVPIHQNEANFIANLLQAAQPKILGW
jgi:hypothetical protein